MKTRAKQWRVWFGQRHGTGYKKACRTFDDENDADVFIERIRSTEPVCIFYSVESIDP